MGVEQQQDVLNQQDQLKFDGKYNAVKKELDEVISSKNEAERKIDKETLKKCLDGAFGERLEKSPQQFKELKDAVKRIKDNPTLQSAAGDGLNILDRFLNAVAVNSAGERDNSKEYNRFFEGDSAKDFGKSDYDNFKKKLSSPDALKDLSNMTVNQINRVKRYLENNPEAAYDVYKTMKPYIDNKTEGTLVRQDKEFFDGVRNSLVVNYRDSDLFLEKTYGEIKPNVDSLSGFLKKFDLGTYKWNGENLWRIPDQKLTMFSNEYIIKNFNKVNTARIEANKDYINKSLTNMNIGEMNKEQFQSKVKEFSDRKLVQFVDDNEMNRYVEEKWGEIESQRAQTDLNNTIDSSYISSVENTAFSAVSTEAAGQYQFIEKKDNNYIVYPERAVNYLLSLKNNNGGLKSWRELKALDDKNGEKKAWIAAVQVLLNNIPGLGNPIQINGNFEQKNNDATFNKVKKFQESKNDVFNSKNRGFYVDGLPGPNTIKALTDAYKVKVENGKTADDIRGTLEDLKEVGDEQDRKSYGVEGKLYKNRINSADKAIYYRSGNDVYKISTDQPWERQKAKAIDDGKGGIKVEWEVEPYACNAGAEKITEGLKSIGDKKLNVALENGKYRLTSEGGVTIDFDADVKNPVFNKDFCGNTGVDRFKLVALASRVKKNGDGDVKIASVDQSGTTTQEISVGGKPTGIFASEMFNYYGLENKNEENIKSFLAYCNNLKGKEGVYSYEKKDSK